MSNNLSKPLDKLIQLFDYSDKVLDIGCLGWRLKKARPELTHAGCDIGELKDVPDGFDFKICDLNTDSLPWEDDTFSLVVISHVIEHLSNPILCMGEAVRVCRPGGYIYLEAPSDRAVIPFPFKAGPHAFLNHWDDPTHHRPWSPRAMYRLITGYNCIPVSYDYITDTKSKLTLILHLFRNFLSPRDDLITEKWWGAIGFSAYAVAKKPRSLQGKQTFQYRSLRGIKEEDIINHLKQLDV